MTISRTPYIGLGIIVAPKSKQYAGHLIINILFWEVNIRWGEDAE